MSQQHLPCAEHTTFDPDTLVFWTAFLSTFAYLIYASL